MPEPTVNEVIAASRERWPSVEWLCVLQRTDREYIWRGQDNWIGEPPSSPETTIYLYGIGGGFEELGATTLAALLQQIKEPSNGSQ